MTRHGKNNTASPCYTYYERQRDTRTSGYGTQKQRLNKDSIKDFDACSLTLQSCKQPVVTPDGILFDKEAILEYLIHKKQDALRQLKQWEKQNKRDKRAREEMEEAAEQDKTNKFLALERSITNPASATSGVSGPTSTVHNSSSKSSAAESSAIVLYKVPSETSKVVIPSKVSVAPSNSSAVKSVSNMAGSKSTHLPSFWIPSLTPESKETRLKKPSAEVLCPITSKPLKAKDLIPIKFTPIDASAKLSASVKDRYMCPVTHDVLSNSIPLAVLKTSYVFLFIFICILNLNLTFCFSFFLLTEVVWSQWNVSTSSFEKT